MIKVNQIRAARGLLGWQQKDLARMAGISELSVINFENNKTTPHQGTLDKIAAAFELAGIGFTPNRVEMKENSFTVLSGEGWYSRMLEDIKRTFDMMPSEAKKEEIIFHADERRNNAEDFEKVRVLQKKGVKSRLFIEEGNTYIPGDLSRYRYLPKEHYNNNGPVYCYGDKVAFVKQTREKGEVHILRNALLTAVILNLTDLLWDQLPQPRGTTVLKKDRY
jgi:transcriptional regulator with XRE-family HTH domain